MLSTMSDTKEIPRLTLHHRLDIALDHGGVGVSEMADFLGVSRNTITNYIHGKTRPNRATLMTWADRCAGPGSVTLLNPIRQRTWTA